MRRRILLSTLLSLLLAGSIAALVAVGVAGRGSHLGREAACATEHEGGGEARCETVADMGRELQEPADALLARDLFGSDQNINYEKAFTDAAADGEALAGQTARVDA